MLFRSEKFSFLSGLDLFALTSHSENFALVVIESLSVGTPVLIGENVGLYEYVLQNDCGWVGMANIDAVGRCILTDHEQFAGARRDELLSFAQDRIGTPRH